jgi:hypothetical protein
MVALRKDLVAIAHTLKFAADFFHAVGLLLGEKRHNGEKRDSDKRDDEATSLRTTSGGNI